MSKNPAADKWFKKYEEKVELLELVFRKIQGISIYSKHSDREKVRVLDEIHDLLEKDEDLEKEA